MKNMDFLTECLVAVGVTATWYYFKMRMWSSSEYKRYEELKKNGVKFDE